GRSAKRVYPSHGVSDVTAEHRANRADIAAFGIIGVVQPKWLFRRCAIVGRASASARRYVEGRTGLEAQRGRSVGVKPMRCFVDAQAGIRDCVGMQKESARCAGRYATLARNAPDLIQVGG
ncbi:MAG: hypothetical protein K0U93_18520, partial [Gammaproteobacteria bacterium]|nr:hypothetical protein [Gammaproteobacteria bacterium]